MIALITETIKIIKKNLGLQWAQSVAWFGGLTYVKVLAITVINCFLLTGVYGPAVSAVLDNARENGKFNGVIEEFVLPHLYGMITDAHYNGSETVIVHIQDLHSHPQVQRNISGIIKTFDDKYGVKNVYLEGAYGQVDTSWISSIKDDTLREKLLEAMINNGSLTGAEYYSVKEKKEKIIKGLEEKDQYLGNLKRFADLLNAQNDIGSRF